MIRLRLVVASLRRTVSVPARNGNDHLTTTRKHYAPLLVSRLKQASETLSGRFSD